MRASRSKVQNPTHFGRYGKVGATAKLVGFSFCCHSSFLSKKKIFEFFLKK